MNSIGLFFGSFNPIHMGHLIIANSMAHLTPLNKVWFVVSPQNPFKQKQSLAHEFDRYDMVRQAIHDNEYLDVTDIEFNMPKPSFTVDTLAYLESKYPDKEFSLIIGEDNLEHFDKWKNAELILQRHKIYVYPRPKKVSVDVFKHPNIYPVQAPMIDISATFIRSCIKNNRSIRYLVHPEVERYIYSRKLYGA